MRKTFVKKGLREIWKHKVQYIFLMIILGCGVAMYSSFYDLGQSREATLDAIYEESEFMDAQVKILYGETVNMSTIDGILDQPGVGDKIESIEYRLTFDVFINHSTDSGVRTTKGIIIGFHAFDSNNISRESTVNKPLFYVDDPPNFESSDAYQCYLERKFAKAFDLDSGDQITVLKGAKNIKLDLLAQVSIPEYFFVIQEGSLFPSERSLGVILVPINVARELYFGNGPENTQVNDIVILLKDPDDLEDFKNTINQEFQNKGIAVDVKEKEENPARRFLYDDLKNDRESMNIFPIVIFLVSAFALVMVLRRMIRVHRPQIGVFKSLGVPNRVVLSYFTLIGIFVAVFGTIIGFLIAIPINNSLGNLLNGLYDFPIMKLTVSWRYYVEAGIFSLVLCLFCTIIPTWIALRIKPIDAIQNREALTTGKGKKGTKKVGWSSKLPVPLKLTLRNLIRKPGRTTTSILGVALALALFLGFVILMDSVIVLMDRDAELSEWDYEVVMDGFSSVDLVQNWSIAHPEIEHINPGILLPTSLTRGDKTEDGIIYALEDVQAAYEVDLEKGNFGDDGMVISIYHMDKLDVDSGDTVELELPYFDPVTGFTKKQVEVPIVGVHSNHIGYYIFMDLSTLQEYTNLIDQANIIYLNTEDGKAFQSLENTLITTPHVSSVTYSEDRENLLEQYFSLFVGVVYLIALLSIGLATAIVYNLFMISAQENKRNYATMKTLGTSLKRLGYLIFIEAGFIALIGIILGGILGYLLALGLVAEASEFEVWNFGITFSWSYFAIGAILVIFVVVFVSLLTIRYIHKINIANVIRERSTG